MKLINNIKVKKDKYVVYYSDGTKEKMDKNMCNKNILETRIMDVDSNIEFNENFELTFEKRKNIAFIYGGSSVVLAAFGTLVAQSASPKIVATLSTVFAGGCAFVSAANAISFRYDRKRFDNSSKLKLFGKAMLLERKLDNVYVDDALDLDKYNETTLGDIAARILSYNKPKSLK